MGLIVNEERYDGLYMACTEDESVIQTAEEGFPLLESIDPPVWSFLIMICAPIFGSFVYLDGNYGFGVLLWIVGALAAFCWIFNMEFPTRRKQRRFARLVRKGLMVPVDPIVVDRYRLIAQKLKLHSFKSTSRMLSEQWQDVRHLDQHVRNLRSSRVSEANKKRLTKAIDRQLTEIARHHLDEQKRREMTDQQYNAFLRDSLARKERI